jgi:hypothetical protein
MFTTKKGKKSSTPQHGSIKCFYAVVYDAHIGEWVFVPCSRADLLRKVVVL